MTRAAKTNFPIEVIGGMEARIQAGQHNRERLITMVNKENDKQWVLGDFLQGFLEFKAVFLIRFVLILIHDIVLVLLV